MSPAPLRRRRRQLGLYGNTGEEAIYLPYFVDANHQPLDAFKTAYTLLFPKGQLPPAHAFWSLTMYDGKTQFLVANPLKRYLLNSTMVKSFKYGSDGSLTIYVQKSRLGLRRQRTGCLLPMDLSTRSCESTCRLPKW